MTTATAKTDDDGNATLEPVHAGLGRGRGERGRLRADIGVHARSARRRDRRSSRSRCTRASPVSGRVVDEARQADREGARQRERWLGTAAGGEPIAVTTDAKGEFTFAALAAGTHVLDATDGEHAPARPTPVTVDAIARSTGIEITMKAGGVARRHRRRRRRQARCHSRPYASPATAQQHVAWSRRARRRPTRHGTFELRGLSRAKLQARAESDAAASKIVDVDLVDASRPRRDVKLVLDVTGTIAGIVVDDDRPAGARGPGQRVPRHPRRRSAPRRSRSRACRRRRPTAPARFTIRGLPDGAYRLWRRARVGRRQYGWGQQGTPAKTGDKNVQDHAAGARRLVKGTIVARERRRRRSSRRVAARLQHPATPRDDGTFEIKDLSPGTYDLTCAARVRRARRSTTSRSSPARPPTSARSPCMRGRKLVGKVVDASGTPVAGREGQGSARCCSRCRAPTRADRRDCEEMAGVRTAIDRSGRRVHDHRHRRRRRRT